MTPEPSNAVVLRPVNPEVLIASAIEKGVDVGVMERLLLMRKELKMEAAKEAYDHALAAFQSECPPIQKTKKVMNKDGRSIRYSYAPLEAIIAQVKDLLQRHGFSYRVNTISEQDKVKAICTSTHSLGHSENSEFEVPVENGAFMSAPQQYASSLTFAKRYAFCNAFGIMTADEDNDANHEAAPKTAQAQSTTEPKKASSSDVLAQPREATDATRLWFLGQLRAQYDDEQIREYFEAKAMILPTEKLEDWPLRFVPTTKPAINELLRLVGVFANGGEPADDPEDVDSPNAIWRSHVVHFGKDKGTTLADLDKKTLFGWWANYEPKPYNGKLQPADVKFREMLDCAGEHYEFEKD